MKPWLPPNLPPEEKAELTRRVMGVTSAAIRWRDVERVLRPLPPGRASGQRAARDVMADHFKTCDWIGCTGCGPQTTHAREILGRLSGPQRAALRWYGQPFAKRPLPRPRTATANAIFNMGLASGYLLTAELTPLGRDVLAAIDAEIAAAAGGT